MGKRHEHDDPRTHDMKSTAWTVAIIMMIILLIMAYAAVVSGRWL